MSNESIDARKAEFEVVTLFKQRGLYTSQRIFKPTIPENLYKYDLCHRGSLRGSDSNFLTPATIEKGVEVNYCGSIIFAKPLDFGEKDYKQVKKKINFLGEPMKLAAEHKTLNQRYISLKDEVKEAEQIRKSVYSILKQEQWERQPRRVQDMEH